MMPVKRLSPRKLKQIVEDARTFSFRFLELRREFALLLYRLPESPLDARV